MFLFRKAHKNWMILVEIQAALCFYPLAGFHYCHEMGFYNCNVIPLT